MKRLTDEDIKFYSNKYKLDMLHDCINNIKSIKVTAKDINCDKCKEIKILKSVEEITKGLLKCAK